MASSTLQVAVDELVCPEVGAWAEEKYRLVSLYQELFATGMKDKWDKRVYLDLYSGAGHARIRGTSRVVHGAALRALLLRHPFDKYIFCEKVPEYLDALRVRALRLAPSLDIDYISGDCDLNADRVCSLIPQHSSTQRVLSLCFVDPFDFRD